MKKYISKNKGFVSVEIIIVASIIFSVGFGGVVVFTQRGTTTINNNLSKLDETGVFQNTAIKEETVIIVPSAYIVSFDDGFIMTRFAQLDGSYSGVRDDIQIPSGMNGVLIKEIWQETFRNKGLISVSFSPQSIVTRIHARAFYNNSLTKITLPETLTRIDLWSFKNNNLTELVLPESVVKVEADAFTNNNIVKITIGSKLATIGLNAFGINDAGFTNAYTIGGAGTYNFINGVWIKQ